jgi:hypothetical protein
MWGSRRIQPYLKNPSADQSNSAAPTAATARLTSPRRAHLWSITQQTFRFHESSEQFSIMISTEQKADSLVQLLVMHRLNAGKKKMENIGNDPSETYKVYVDNFKPS